MNAAMEPAQAILVAGMHRSGTSVLTRIINLHGAVLGSRLLAPTPDNQTGYWENWHVVMFHERVLRELDKAWDSPDPISSRWVQTPHFESCVQELCEILAREFGGERLWAVKDPRICLMLPLWREALGRLGIEPKFVFEVRHPDEVIGSLVKRDNLGPGLASLLWLNYVRYPVEATRGNRRVMFLYEDVLKDWRGCIEKIARELDVRWPVSMDDSAARVDAYLDPSMRHHHVGEGASCIPAAWRDEITGLFDACKAASAAPDGWALLEQRLAGLTGFINALAPLAGGVPSPSQLSRQCELTKSASEEAASLRRELADARRREEGLTASLADREDALAQAHGENQRLHSDLATMGHELGQVRSSLAASEDALAQAHGENQRLHSDHLFAQRRGEMLEAELGRTRQQLGDVLQSHSWRLTMPLRLAVRLMRGDLDYLREGMRSRRARRMENGQPATCVDAGLPQRDLSQLAASIRFAHVEHPLVSVLVIGQDGSLLAGRTLQGLAQQKRREEVEVFLLPVGMSANDIETFSGIDGLGVLEEREFPAEWETVARLPLRGEYVFVVKGGVVVADDCLDALLSTLGRHADCAMAGPKSVRATGELKEAGTVVGCDGAIEAYGAGGAPERSDCNYVREVDACGDAALLIRKASLVAAKTEGLGGLTRRVPWIELAFELRAAGGRTVYQPKARVVDERTDASGDGEATARLGDRWTALPDFRRDGRGPKKTILVVDHAVPQPDRDAGSRSMWHFMRMFQCRGFDVKFWPHDQRHDAVYVELLQQHGIEVLLGHQGGFPAWFARHAADLHSVLLSRPHVALEYLSLVRRHASTRLPLLYYGHDIHYMRLGAQLKHASSPELERQVAQHVAWEQAIWPAVDVVYYPAGNETELVRAWLLEHGHRHVTARTIPVYAFDSVPEVSRRDLAERKGIMFVGGFAHAPNADAAKWFAHEVMPLVVKEHPDAKLYLLGSNPTSEIRALSSRHVTVVGYVTEDELVDYYAKMRLSVAPLRFGAGMKGKVIEAMRHGLPCVMTSVGAQGLEDASFLAVADDPKSFAEQVARFLGDDEYWAANSASSQRLVRERFSEQALWNVVRQDLEDGRPYGA